MLSFQKLARVPSGMRTADLVLRPIREEDAELDHEAVMESRKFLRLWEQTSWPEDDFTVQANREDLKKLEKRHAARESFAYTVVNPSEKQCLGCVYIFPIGAEMLARAHISSVGGADWSDYAAAVYFWIRKSKLGDSLDRALLDRLGPWFAQDWNFDNVLIITNEQFEQQVAMIESKGLPLRFRINDPKAAGSFLGYEIVHSE